MASTPFADPFEDPRADEILVGEAAPLHEYELSRLLEQPRDLAEDSPVAIASDGCRLGADERGPRLLSQRLRLARTKRDPSVDREAGSGEKPDDQDRGDERVLGRRDAGAISAPRKMATPTVRSRLTNEDEGEDPEESDHPRLSGRQRSRLRDPAGSNR